MVYVHLFLTGVNYSPPEVPQQAQSFFPENTESFADGLWEMLKRAISFTNPNLAQAANICVCVFGIILLILLLDTL